MYPQQGPQGGTPGGAGLPPSGQVPRRLPVPAGQVPMRPEIRLAQQQQQQLLQQQQQQQQQFHQYGQYPPHHPQQQQMFIPGQFPTNPSEAALRQAQMQSLRQQQMYQHPGGPAAAPFIPAQPPAHPPQPVFPQHLAQLPKFPGPGPSADTESTLKSEWEDKVMKLNPRPMIHPKILEGLSNKSVGYLCGIGKDLIQELAIRMLSLSNIFKSTATAWKSNSFAEVEFILSYCKYLLEKIREIRAYIDRKILHNQKLSANDFVELMALPIPTKPPKHIQELRTKYHGNECHLQRMSNAFKKVEWLGENSDPKNVSLSLKEEVQRITAAEESRRVPIVPIPKKV